MNKRRITLISVMVMLLASMLAVGGAQAAPQAPTKPAPPKYVSFLYVRTATLDPGNVWIDKDGLHIRGRVDSGVVTGDIKGSTTVVYNADFKFLVGRESIYPQPNSGTAYGSIEIRSDDLDLPAPLWSGKWEYKISGGMVMDGSLSASSSVARRMLVIDSVQQLGGGGLLHQGYIFTIGPNPG